jgi:SmpA/OmlA family protein
MPLQLVLLAGGAMNWLTRLRPWLIGALFLVGIGYIAGAFLAGYGSCSGIGSRLAPELTKEGLLKLRPGMSEDEVVKLIGQPLEKQPPSDPRWDSSWTWVYGAPGIMETGIEIGIGMHSGRLVNAGAEIHDLGVFWCRPNGCPVIWDEEGLDCLPREKEVR